MMSWIRRWLSHSLVNDFKKTTFKTVTASLGFQRVKRYDIKITFIDQEHNATGAYFFKTVLTINKKLHNF